MTYAEERSGTRQDIERLMGRMYEQLASDWVRTHYMAVLSDGVIRNVDQGKDATVWVESPGLSLRLTWDEATVLADYLEDQGHSWAARKIRERVAGARQWDSGQQAARAEWTDSKG